MEREAHCGCAGRLGGRIERRLELRQARSRRRRDLAAALRARDRDQAVEVERSPVVHQSLTGKERAHWPSTMKAQVALILSTFDMTLSALVRPLKKRVAFRVSNALPISAWTALTLFRNTLAGMPKPFFGSSATSRGR